MSDTSNLLPPDAATNSDPFAGGSVSPDIFRNLMTFGASMAAAGAKPGSTFASSLGQGVLSAEENARQNAQSKTAQQLSQQDIASKQLGNAQNLYNIQQQNMTNKLIDPAGQYFPQMQIPNTPALNALQQPNMQSAQTAPRAPANPATMPSSTQANGAGQPQESSGIAGPTWGSSAGAERTNSSPQTNVYPAGSSGTPAPQPSLGVQQAGMPGVDPDALRKSILIGRGLVQPQTPQEAYQAIRYTTNPDLAKALSTYAMAGQTAGATAAATLPYDIQKERSGFTTLRGGGSLPSSVYDLMNNKVVAEGAQEGVVPAGQKDAGANYRIPPSIMGGSSPLAPGVNIQQPSTMSAPQQPSGEAAAMQVAAAQSAPISTSELQAQSAPAPASSVPMPPAPAQGPQINAGQPQPIGSGVAAPQSGVPAGAIQTSLAPASKELLTEGTKDMIEKQRPAYEAAQQTINGSAVIEADIDKLGPTGWFAPGAGSAERQTIAKGWNSSLTAAGFTPEANGDLFAPLDKIATGEELNKQTVNLGFNLARTMGARESQQVVEQAIKINPGLGTTYLGGKMVNGLISENAQRTKDQYEYKLSAMNNGIDPLNAETAFNKQYAGTAYVQRAMSQFAPVNVATPGALKNLLPGTVVSFRGAPPKAIPVPKDYPFSLPPTNHQFEGQ